MEQLLDDDIKALFPADVTKSMMVDVLRQCGGDKDKAKDIAKGMAGAEEEEKSKDKDRKISELKETFSALTREELKSVLESNNWDVEAAILPCYGLIESKQSEEKKSRQQEKNQKDKEDALNFLRVMFKGKLTEQKLQDMLDENEGDVNATSDQVLALLSLMDEENKESIAEAQEREKNEKLEGLVEMFQSHFIVREDVQKVLEQHKWDEKEATVELLRLSRKNKVEFVSKLYKTVEVEKVKDVLKSSDWDVKLAMVRLNEEKARMDREEDEKKERDQRVIEENERKEKEEKERREKGENERREKEEKERKEKEEKERREKEENERRQREENEKKERERIEQETLERQEHERRARQEENEKKEREQRERLQKEENDKEKMEREVLERQENERRDREKLEREEQVRKEQEQKKRLEIEEKENRERREKEENERREREENERRECERSEREENVKREIEQVERREAEERARAEKEKSEDQETNREELHKRVLKRIESTELAERKAKKEAEELELQKRKMMQQEEELRSESDVLSQQLSVRLQQSRNLRESQKNFCKAQIETFIRGAEMPGVPTVIEERLRVNQEEAEGENKIEGPLKPNTDKKQDDKTEGLQHPNISGTSGPQSLLNHNIVQITIPKLRFETNEEIHVEWKFDPQGIHGLEAKDWIGLYKVGSTATQYETWNWVSNSVGEKQGKFMFHAPTNYYQYQFRFYGSGTSILKGESPVFSMGPLIEMGSTYSKKDNKIGVSITQKAGRVHLTAWIGMYLKDETDNTKYRAFDWCSNAVDHVVKFEAFKAAEWEFRYFPSRSTYADVARTTLKVSGEDSVQTKLRGGEVVVNYDISSIDPRVDAVWCGLYVVGEQDNTKFSKFKYVEKGLGTLTFTVNGLTKGEYEARFFGNRSYDCVCRSENTVTVQ